MISEIKLLSRILLSNFIRLTFPYKLSFGVTYRCNLRCEMCFIWKKKKGPPELSAREIDLFFKKSNDFSWVGLTGGEVFLREDLVDIVSSIIKNCKNLCVLHFPTNGYFTDKILGDIRTIVDLGPRRLYVTISVDGPPHIHDKIRGREGSWHRAMDTFAGLMDIEAVEPYISMTLSHSNLGVIDETIAAIKNAYRPFEPKERMNFNIFQRSSHYFENVDMKYPNIELLKSDIRYAMEVLGLDKVVSIKSYLQKNYLARCPQYLSDFRSPLPCRALSASCYLDPSGDVYPCGVYGKRIGNVKDYDFSLRELWEKKEVKRLYHDCKRGNCPGCWTPCDAYQSINANLPKLFR